MPLAELMRVGTARSIVRWGEPILHSSARPVDDFGSDLQQLLADMFATNLAAEGAGLAAQQIGSDRAVFIYDCYDETWTHRAGVICNPTLELPVGDARHLATYQEGCLSLPGAHADLGRPDTATCRGQDQYGDPVVVTAGGTLGRCLQHETDHINGIVFGDRLTSRSRRQLQEQAGQASDRFPRRWPQQSRDSLR